MTQASVTVVISPRDRYSGIVQCIENLYRCTPEPFVLKVLDLGYPAHLKREIKQLLQDKDNAELVECGLIIPMDALNQIRHTITTLYTMLLDNDSNVTPGWLAPLLETAEATGAAVINPLTLEKEGVDEGAALRNHLYTNALQIVDVKGTEYLIEHKSFRRALPEDIPKQIADSEMFELHGVLFLTKALQQIELPSMVIREHIDIGIQLRKLGYKLLSQPQSVIIFDNLGTRMSWFDIRFFFFRWHPTLTYTSSRLFERRWHYNFYAEHAMYHWVFRRKVFLICRWLYLPVTVSNKVVRVLAKLKSLIKPVWNPLSDPAATARPAELDRFTKQPQGN
jgi:GT2 family glycosyltransferase